jgi:methylthioribose-1-phosphate isomerase
MTAETSPAIRAVEWLGDRLRLLDQTMLPAKELYVEVTNLKEVTRAIRRLAVRGAPLLGIVAGYGMALASISSPEEDPAGLMIDLARAGESLVRSRPTAVNISWAVDRVLAAAASTSRDPASIRRAVEAEADRIAAEDAASCQAIGRLGAALIQPGANVLTVCNTGALATGGIGTALGIIVSAHQDGKRPHVFAAETRPLLQGARLTAWELRRLGIAVTLLADSAAATLMAGGSVDLVIVGADRIAMNGDVANKVGTYALAVAAHHHGIPFYVAAPISTVDPNAANGGEIPIERRNPNEVTTFIGQPIAPEGTWAINPAFDVTPSDLVTAIVTDQGVVRAPVREQLRDQLRAAAGSGAAVAEERVAP